jgi:hypothetical protein
LSFYARWNPSLVTYAAARDAVCWQLKHDVGDACDLLAGCEEVTASFRQGEISRI